MSPLLEHAATRSSTPCAALERDHPELFAAYSHGELSANAAAIAAGFRKKPVKRCPKCGHEF
jgi:hypothetical protein